MSESTKNTIYNEEESNKWSQQQYLVAIKYCNKHQLKVANFDQPQSRVLPPLLAIWRVNLATQPKTSIWLIGGGEIMMDHADVSMAANARDAVRHFSMSWQLKASQMEAATNTDSSGNIQANQQQKVINTLIREAESLYTLFANEQAWISNG